LCPRQGAFLVLVNKRLRRYASNLKSTTFGHFSFYRDKKLHCVDENSLWAWNPEKGKWGWPVEVIKVLAQPLPVTKRIGIKYTKNILLAMPRK
jgi:hypothetical protein